METIEVNQTKRTIDAAKIESFESSGRFKHGYDYVEWRDWNGNNYIKSYYDVMMPDGSIVKHVRPNAGILHVGNLRLDKDSGVKVRLSSDLPY